MEKLFKSDELQTKLEVDGFVKIQLLNKEEVTILTDAYEKYRADHEKINIPYITTCHSNNPQLIEAVDAVLQTTLAHAIDKFLVNYKLLLGNYLVKMPVKNSETEPHQDITFVDENKFVSVNIWVALQDTNEDNGCMYFLKGSHKFSPTVRPTHSFPWLYENVKEEIKKQSISFPVKAGEAFVFNHAVVHGSHANKSEVHRLAAVVAAYSDKAPLIHYFLPEVNSNMLQKYSMTKEAYIYFEKEKPPVKGVFLGKEKFDFEQLDKNQYKKIAQKNSPSRFQQLLSLFSKIDVS